MKLQKVIMTSLLLPCLISAPAMADEAMPPSSQANTSAAPADKQEKNFDCHYKGSKESADMQAKITKDGDKFYWTDSVGEEGPLTILPNHTITLDYTYVAKNKAKVSGKMSFTVKEDHSLDGTFEDGFDKGTITCTERKA